MRRTGQTFLEYTLLFGILVAVLVAMSPLIRRGAQSMVKVVADQVGNQLEAEQRGGEAGHLISSNTLQAFSRETIKGDRIYSPSYVYDDTTRTSTNVLLNQGFTPRR